MQRTKQNKKKSEITLEFGYLKVDGRYFELDEKTPERARYIEVSNNKVKAKIKLLSEIAEKLKENLDANAVLMEALSKLPEEYLTNIHNAVYNSKKKVKPKTRKHHCVDMKVGKMVIPIIS